MRSDLKLYVTRKTGGALVYLVTTDLARAQHIAGSQGWIAKEPTLHMLNIELHIDEGPEAVVPSPVT